MRLIASFYYRGSHSGPIRRTVEVLGIHKPFRSRAVREIDLRFSSTVRTNRPLTLFGNEITDGKLPQFKTYHVEKCLDLSIELTGEFKSAEKYQEFGRDLTLGTEIHQAIDRVLSERRDA